MSEPSITSVLVANRGEIARRVFRTCRDLGVRTVAVHSDPDAGAPYVHEADAAVRLPGAAPGETYLRAEAIVEAARRSGADAVHPGYGFLSENAEFARAVQAAGLVWIGPPPEAIAAMGGKVEAKRMMAAAGVPVLDELRPEAVSDADLPVIVKASAGGGGRGMRVVRELADLPQEIATASAEAQSAFGDPTVFCEPYLATGHHVEVQVLADAHGTVWCLGERECSIQRRHQKIVEEAPSPLVERVDGMRERLFDAARAAAKAIGYLGAGTVEFLADDDGRFFFLEMNTRLQVEHPVTECTTGTDLVALQLFVARGGRLDAEPPPATGSSIEVRLYAEDPAADWQPQSGTVHLLDVPDVGVRFDVGTRERGLRLDTGVESGSAVSIHYDPMLAKVISWAPARTTAAALLADTLRRTRVHGLRTNRDLLVRVLTHPAFLAGATDTAFLPSHGLAELSRPLGGAEADRLCALAAVLADDAAAREHAPVLRGIPSGWRNVVSQNHSVTLGAAAGEVSVSYRLDRAGLMADGYDDVTLVSHDAATVVLEADGVRHRFQVARYGADRYVDSAIGARHFTVADRFPDPSSALAAGSLLAPMPGSVVRIAVHAGEVVRAGQPILWLEAMKMQHQIDAPADGVVSELPVSAGQQVDVGAVLAIVTPQQDDPEESQ